MKKLMQSFMNASIGEKVYTVVRILFGLVLFFGFAIGKLSMSAEEITGIGTAISYFGITSGFFYFGLLAVIAETAGSIALSLGLLTRLSAFGIAFTMLVASVMHIQTNTFNIIPIIFAVIAGVFIIGGGRALSLDKLCKMTICKKGKTCCANKSAETPEIYEA